MTVTPTFLLHMRLFTAALFSPNGDTDVDAQIASTLNVAALPYTSNDTNAQSLKPAGWSWDLDDQENIIAVRASDNATAYGIVLDSDNNLMKLPDPLVHCLAAVRAILIETNDVS